jgi:hypothetical protein
MTSKKNWGSTVMGWFVVKEDGELGSEPSSIDTGLPDMPSAGGAPDDAAANDADAIIARAAGMPSRGAASSVGPSARVCPRPSGPRRRLRADRSTSRRSSRRSATTRRSSRASTGPTAPREPARRDRRRAEDDRGGSLKAFGIPTDKIIEAAAEQIRRSGLHPRRRGRHHEVLEEARRIADFEEEIRRIKNVMEQRIHEQNAVTRACNDKKLEVQKVLEFFGQEAVARVVKESPRLVEPETPSGARPKGRT